MHPPEEAARRGAGGEHKGLGKKAITTVARTCLALLARGRLRKRWDSEVLVFQKQSLGHRGYGSLGTEGMDPWALRTWIPSKCGRTYVARQAEQPWEPAQPICS